MQSFVVILVSLVVFLTVAFARRKFMVFNFNCSCPFVESTYVKDLKVSLPCKDNKVHERELIYLYPINTSFFEKTFNFVFSVFS